MKHFYLILLWWPIAGSAQTFSSSVLSSAGAQFTTPTVQLSFTIGQAVASERSAGAVLLHQGFQVSIIEAGPTATTELPRLEVFPNPTADKLVVSGLTDAGQYRFIWTDLEGRELAVPRSLMNEQVEFDVHALRAAVYFLRVLSAEGHYHLIKIVKTN
jgi:hypothetical protein